MGLREKKEEKTRKRIVDEALLLFKHNGYEPTTMEAIAEAAEVSRATLYRYFPSKDLVLLDHFMIFFEGLPASFSELINRWMRPSSMRFLRCSNLKTRVQKRYFWFVRSSINRRSRERDCLIWHMSN